MLNENWIALIEDDVDIRNLLIEALEGEGYEVRAFADGEQALSQFRQNNFSPPLAIFCDLIMYKMNGLETASQLQSIEKYKAVPFILMSAHNQLENFKEEQKTTCRIDDILSKPFELDDLLTKVSQFFDNVRKS